MFFENEISESKKDIALNGISKSLVNAILQDFKNGISELIQKWL